MKQFFQYQLVLENETWEFVFKTRIPAINLTHFCTFLNTSEASSPIQHKTTSKIKNDWITQGMKISSKNQKC
jgi:hypothetical protein